MEAKVEKDHLNSFINEKCKLHFSGTRGWLFEEVEKWTKMESGSSNLFWLTGDAGTGKTVVSAKLVQDRDIDVDVLAWWFFRHNDESTHDPFHVLKAISTMLEENLDGFNVDSSSDFDLDKARSENNLEGTFTALLEEPLDCVPAQPERKVIVFDALDELPQKFLTGFLNLLTKHLSHLPHWVGFFVTSRRENRIVKALEKQVCQCCYFDCSSCGKLSPNLTYPLFSSSSNLKNCWWMRNATRTT